MDGSVSTSDQKSNEAGTDMRQTRLNMLRNELIGPEIERINERFEKLICSQNDVMRKEFKHDLEKIDYSIKERMAMVEEVIS